MTTARLHPLPPLPDYDDTERLRRSTDFANLVRQRRTVRDFSAKPVPAAVIEQALWAAGSAPSGANQQPWHFAVISNAEIKQRIRAAAEEEEREFYSRRASQEWLQALAPLGTDWQKPFLEIAPYLIVVFSQKWHLDADGNKHKHYYAPESVGIATGILLTALHNAGLATLTHTPSPMGFLAELLGRPESERAEMIVVVGHPAEHCQVPVISKKSLAEYVSYFS
ncbi:nitroreductase family protein [Permianibacter sp. IMCC34836]|uniref:nitroreductase family protein n=1 Tax=Permianibacter fluminis TaxID=2738515 RepID=UPI001556D8B2|nr:nitroreductase family protein [Permianibacter fluminis]NQD36308.1 nitroreductase family protein [Permianibacter fluminis]